MARKRTIKLHCAECRKEVVADIVGGEIIYPHRLDLASKLFALCPTCHNYVGVGSEIELLNYKEWNNRYHERVIPTPELREYRKSVHDIIDRVWKQGLMSRGAIYRRLSKATGIEGYHNGSLKDVQTAKLAQKEAEKIYQEATAKLYRQPRLH